MNFPADLLALRVGDVVEFDDGLSGPVVFNSASGAWSAEYPQEAWEHLGPGVMVRTLVAGLVFTEAQNWQSGACRVILP